MTARLLRRPLAVLAVLGAVLLIVPAAPVSAAPCYGSSCNNQDPDAIGCSRDAIDLTEALIADTPGFDRVRMRLRYSATCGAAWALLTAGATGYAGVQHRYVVIAAWYNTSSTSSLTAVPGWYDMIYGGGHMLAAGQSVHSRMYQYSPWWVSACLSPVTYAGPSNQTLCTSRH